jgi:hypothetical protein
MCGPFHFGGNEMTYDLHAVTTQADWRAMHDIRRATLFTPERHPGGSGRVCRPQHADDQADLGAGHQVAASDFGSAAVHVACAALLSKWLAAQLHIRLIIN